LASIVAGLGRTYIYYWDGWEFP